MGAGEVIVRPRVAVFSGYYASQGGGIEMTTGELVACLRKSGMIVDWTALDDREPGPKGKYPVPGSNIVYERTGVPLPIPAPSALTKIWRVARLTDVIVVVEANFLVSALGFLAAKLLGKPTLLIQHVGQPSTVSRLARLLTLIGDKLIVRPVVRNADRCVCVSPVVAEHHRRDRDDIVSIGHHLDTATFRPEPDEMLRHAARASFGLAPTGGLACFVGRLTASKGVHVMEQLARRLPHWTFAVAGAGPVDIAAWRLPNIVPLGQLDREAVARLYRICDVTILPSPSESFSLVVREALASGSRVVCCDQVLETDPGLEPYLETTTVDLDDGPATADRFAAIVEGCDRTPNDAARTYVEQQCGWEATQGRYVDLIFDLFNQRVLRK